MRVFYTIGLALSFCLALAAQTESLLIGPGDVLKVDVFDTPEMEQHPKVTDAGTVPLLLVGNLHVSGLTPGEAARSIEAALKEKNFMVHPQVTVTVTEYATQNVYVIGEVHTPGSFQSSTPISLLKALAKAGGLTDLADRHITIELHGDPTQKKVYFFSNESNVAIDNDVTIYPGDIVVVPKVGIVYVLGDVGRPGGYPLATNDSGMTVLQALSMAGSPNKTSILKRTKLVRRTPNGPIEIPIEIASIENGNAPDVQLKPNDIIFVPFSYMKNLVLGSSSIAASAASALIYTHP